MKHSFIAKFITGVTCMAACSWVITPRPRPTHPIPHHKQSHRITVSLHNKTTKSIKIAIYAEVKEGKGTILKAAHSFLRPGQKINLEGFTPEALIQSATVTFAHPVLEEQRSKGLIQFIIKNEKDARGKPVVIIEEARKNPKSLASKKTTYIASSPKK